MALAVLQIEGDDERRPRQLRIEHGLLDEPVFALGREAGLELISLADYKGLGLPQLTPKN